MVTMQGSKTPPDDFDTQFSIERARRTMREYADIFSVVSSISKINKGKSSAKILADVANQLRRTAAGMSPDSVIENNDAAALYRITYFSFFKKLDDRDICKEAKAIAHISSVINKRDGITGALSVCGGWFVQILEGRKDRLVALFDRILRDPRHEDVRALEFGPIAHRQFGGWSMAFSGAIAPDLVRNAAVSYEARGLKAAQLPSESVVAVAAAMTESLNAFRTAAD